MFFFFFFQAEDGIRDAQESRGLGDVYKRQLPKRPDIISSNPNMISPIATSNTIVATPIAGHISATKPIMTAIMPTISIPGVPRAATANPCLLYTSDAADDEDSVDLGGRRII